MSFVSFVLFVAIIFKKALGTVHSGRHVVYRRIDRNYLFNLDNEPDEKINL